MGDFWGCILTNISAGVICIALGYVMKKYRLSSLIAGYNTANAKEKAKWNENELINGTGNICYQMGVVLLIGALLIFIIRKHVFLITTLSWVVFIVALVRGHIHLAKNAKTED